MKFPPPLKFLVPVILLVLGLISSWLEYELDLAHDLDRHPAASDHVAAVAQAHEDPRRQAARSIAVIVFFSLGVWAALHYGVAARLERLARSVRDFGEGQATLIGTLGGGDEVGELSEAFAEMSRNLADRERQRNTLERQVIDAAENERQRIGHELHDGIGQKLTVLLMGFSGLHSELRAKAPSLADKAGDLTNQLRETISEARELSHGLAPVPLWEHGLEHALQALADATALHSGVRCVFECSGTVTVNRESTTGNLYRIAQEAVNNALKHASPGEIRIGLERCGENIVLEIDDDGRGLPASIPEESGIGFRVMRHRVESIGGALEFGAPPAGGTRIAVHIPAES